MSLFSRAAPCFPPVSCFRVSPPSCYHDELSFIHTYAQAVRDHLTDEISEPESVMHHQNTTILQCMDDSSNCMCRTKDENIYWIFNISHKNPLIRKSVMRVFTLPHTHIISAVITRTAVIHIHSFILLPIRHFFCCQSFIIMSAMKQTLSPNQEVWISANKRTAVLVFSLFLLNIPLIFHVLLSSSVKSSQTMKLSDKAICQSGIYNHLTATPSLNQQTR